MVNLGIEDEELQLKILTELDALKLLQREAKHRRKTVSTNVMCNYSDK